MKKIKLFIENILVYGFGGVISKAIPLIMIPIITHLLPGTDVFGASDIINTIVSLTSSLAILGLGDALFRLFFDKEDEEYKIKLCSTSFFSVGLSAAIVSLLLFIFSGPLAFFALKQVKMKYLVWISAAACFATAINVVAAAPSRMQNKKMLYIGMNVLNSVLMYGIACLLIRAGYFYEALPLATFISVLLSDVIYIFINHKWISVYKIDTTLLKPLFSIAIPLIPNFMAYWIFNGSDRFMIVNLLDMNQDGIYAVSSKVGQASQLIYTAFAGGWQYFAFSTMKEKNQVKTNSLIYEYLGVISFAAAGAVFTGSYEMFRILFPEEYLPGFIVAPYLFLAPLLQMLFQVSCNQLIVAQKTRYNSYILFLGIVVNIGMNFILIPKIGIEGAALASLVGYILCNIICYLILTKMKLMQLRLKFYVVSLIFIAYIVCWRIWFTQNTWISLGLECLMVAAFFVLYFSDLSSLVKMIRKERFAKRDEK